MFQNGREENPIRILLFLPALANVFETSIDLLLGMDTIRAEETRLSIHKKAVAYREMEIMIQPRKYTEMLC